MKEKIAVIGLGYVGLPLALKLSEFFNTIGFDKDPLRINELTSGLDKNGDFEYDVLNSSKISFSSDSKVLKDSSIFIVTVPTPVDEDHEPDLTPLKNACNFVGKNLSKGNLVIFESTVYPGCTEDYCGPILERISGLTKGKDFNLGYSPERINPGDKNNRIETITKIVSGDNKDTLERISSIYEKIIRAGLYKAESIKVAEASKLTENIQRDVNIALMNELSEVFEDMNIRTSDVLEAANTKWNFIPFRPGLVGGHCIGVDPYYLISAAKNKGINTPLLNVSRAVNEATVDRVIKYIKSQDEKGDKKILIMGLTFKEDCNDFRNSKSLEIAKRLSNEHKIDLMDPNIENDKSFLASHKFVDSFQAGPYDIIIFAVKHKQFNNFSFKKLKEILSPQGKIVDLTCTFKIPENEGFSL